MRPSAPASVEERILVVRGQRVMLDADLAELYGVSTKALNEQVRRNSDRFPNDFMFRLTVGERRRLREMLSAHRELAQRLEGLERRYDGQLKVVFQAIRQLMEPMKRPIRRQIGFRGGG